MLPEKKTLKFTSHVAYFKSVPPSAREYLEAISQKIEALLPFAKPCIGYNMPAYKSDRIFIYFAAFKNHIGVYPPVKDNPALINALQPYSNEKGNLAFSLKKPMPIDLTGQVALALYDQYAKKSSH